MSRTLEVKSKLETLGVAPKRSLGQNFLVNDHVIDSILRAVQGTGSLGIVEVGPGLGALTLGLSHLNISPFILIEMDRKLAQLWRDQEGAQVVEADALKLNWADLELPLKTVLVSNLPYQIGASLVMDRSLGPSEISHMILMFQREVAQRIAACPRTKEYGLLSVVAQTYWTITTVVDASPEHFYPRPNVHSRVLKFTRKQSSGFLSTFDRRYIQWVKASFSQRRKFLKKNLLSVPSGQSKEFLSEMFKHFNLKDQVRAEELSPEQFQEMFLYTQRQRVDEEPWKN